MLKTVIPMSSITKMSIYVNSSKLSMAKIKQKLGCQYIINLGLFNMNTFTSAGYLTVDGKVYSQVANPYGYAIDKSGKKIVFSYGNNVKYPNFAGCYHVLVRDGEIAIDKATSNKYGYTARSCVGLTKSGDLLLFADKSNRSLYGIAEDAVGWGCQTLLNYDGGGSTQCDFNGSKLTSSRIVHNYLCVWTGNTTTTKPDTSNKTSTTTTTTTAKKKICIDPGHGETCLNGSPDGTYKEYEFAMDVATRLNVELQRCGFDTKMTHTNNVDISLTERANISNNYNADFYISIHTNASGSSWNAANGIETYCVSLGGNAEKFAKTVQSQLIADTGMTNRGVKTASYTVLKKTDAPAILVEYGFHTNQADVAKLKTAEYRQQVAKSTAHAICTQFGVSYVAETNSGSSDEKTDNTTTSTKTEFDLATEWVVARGISDGSNPTDIPTRRQIWLMLYRAFNNK